MEAGALPYFIHLLSSRHKNISEQAVWGIANIAGQSLMVAKSLNCVHTNMCYLGDGPELRDCVIKSGVVSPLIDLIRFHSHNQVFNIQYALKYSMANTYSHSSKKHILKT